MNAAVAIAEQRLPTSGRMNVTTTGYVSIGASPAASGLLREP